MNRLTTNTHACLEKKVSAIYLKASIGATGAPTLVTASSKGVSSITRTGVGAYDIQLQDKYIDYLDAQAIIELAAGSPTVNGGMVVRTNALQASGKLSVGFLDSTGAAAEITNGAVVKIKLELKSSGV